MGQVLEKVGGDCLELPKCDLDEKILPDLPEVKSLDKCNNRDVKILQLVFKEFDVNGNDEIDDLELKMGLLKFGSIVTDKSIKKMVRQLDVGGAPTVKKSSGSSGSLGRSSDIVKRMKEKKKNSSRKDEQVSDEMSVLVCERSELNA